MRGVHFNGGLSLLGDVDNNTRIDAVKWVGICVTVITGIWFIAGDRQQLINLANSNREWIQEIRTEQKDVLRDIRLEQKEMMTDLQSIKVKLGILDKG